MTPKQSRPAGSIDNELLRAELAKLEAAQREIAERLEQMRALAPAVTRPPPPAAAAKPAPATCAAPGCTKPARARGYCNGHYGRLKRGQDVNQPLQKRDGLIELPYSVRVDQNVATDLYAEAARRGVSAFLLTRDILTQWSDEHRRKRHPPVERSDGHDDGIRLPVPRRQPPVGRR